MTDLEFKTRYNALSQAYKNHIFLQGEKSSGEFKEQAKNYISDIDACAYKIDETDPEVISEVKESIYDSLNEHFSNDYFGAYQ